MSNSVPAPAPADAPRPIHLYASYGIGMFANTLQDLYTVIVPLFALSFGASISEVGYLAGIRYAGSAFFAMHGGSLADRIGTRRLLLGCSLVTAIAALLIPALPWFWPLFVLQFVSGLVTTFNWISAQALVAHMCKGDAGMLGRYNFVVRMGTIGAPIAIGTLWDFFGAWPTFGAIALWAVLLHLLTRAVPEQNLGLMGGTRPPLRALLPKVSDYVRSFQLILIPVVLFSIVVSTLRNGTNGIQASTYIAYVESIGFTGTKIGILFAAVEGSIAVASLFAGSARRLGHTEWILLFTAVVAILAISVTPFLGGQFPVLFIAMCFVGAAQGFMQPLVFSIQSRAVGPDHQGAMVGLRMSANRAANMIIPPIAGYFAETFGIEMSFVFVGALFLTLAMVVGIIIATRKNFGLNP